MSAPEKLGGFKVLKDVTLISLFSHRQTEASLSKFFSFIADKKINLPYVTCVFDDNAWGLNIAVESRDAGEAIGLIEEAFEKKSIHHPDNIILSIFPHKKNPEVTGSLFEAFGREGVNANALANSPSAISIVLNEKVLNKASSALFGPFSFSAYRTPADWKLAQKGKEQLYKEVVASFQEQRPKVYGLEYQDNQEFLRVRLNTQNIGDFGASFKEFARLGLNLTFLSTSPCDEEGKEEVAFCLPVTENSSYIRIMNGTASHADPLSLTPVATFSLNGPHFGDRYGIASELLMALETCKVNLLGLSCTIASITGVVPSTHLTSTIEAIKGCFDIPSIIERT